MTEEQKRQLDVIRDRETHPAITCDQLPSEAQSYINELEMEAYDAKQQALAGRTIALSAFGAYLIDANFLHFINFANWWSAIVAAPLLVLPWLFYVWQWRRNAKEFSPRNTNNGWFSPSDERLREAWELDYIVRYARSRD